MLVYQVFIHISSILISIDGLLTTIQYHPDGLILATGVSTGLIQIWDMKTQSVVTNFNEHSDGIQALAFSENGYHMASAGLDGCVKLWDLRNGNCIQSLTVDSTINSIGFDYTGSYLGVAASDFTVYQSKSWEKVYQNQENMNGFYSMSFGPSAKYVYVGCGNRSVVKLSQ